MRLVLRRYSFIAVVCVMLLSDVAGGQQMAQQSDVNRQSSQATVTNGQSQPAVTADEQQSPDSASQAPAGESAESSPADASIVAPSPPDGKAEQVQALTVEQLEIQLTKLQQQIAAAKATVTPERSEQLGVSQEELQRQVTLLLDLENAIQRRITSFKRLHETRQLIGDLEGQVQGLTQMVVAEQPPYKLSLLDSLHDELAMVTREAEGEQLALETMNSSVKQAEERLQEAARNRREIRDQLEQLEEAAPRANLQWQLELAQQSERLAEHELAQAQAQLQLTQSEIQSHELRSQLVEAKIAYVSDKVTFTRRELDQRLVELEADRETLENELRSLRRLDQANQVRLEEARAAVSQARGEDEIRSRTEALATREAMATTSSRGVELLQERINNITNVKQLWQRRFALTQEPTAAELAAWRRETRNTLEKITRRRQEIEQRLSTLRAKILDIQKRSSSADVNLPEKSELDLHLSALQEQETRSTNYLASLLTLEQLARRVDEEIERERQLNSWRKYRAWLVYTAGTYWNWELFVIDDRSFRLGDLLLALIVFGVAMLVAWIVRKVMRRTLLRHLQMRVESSSSLLDDVLLVVARQTNRTFVVLIAAYFALITLSLSDTLRTVVNSIAIIALTVQMAIWANSAVKRTLEKIKTRRIREDPSAASAFGLMSFFSHVAIWSAALLLILTNLGYEIGPLLAGLGVGGVAVAFALQSILGDIFCSIAIVLDKPFVLGDFIIVNDMLGSVESIGIKTTRIRSLSGEQIIFSNADLLNSRVRNYKRMFERRVAFEFGVVYETPIDKLRQIPVTVRTIIESLECTRFDRAHFKEYGDFSLNFEVVYYVLQSDYNLYMDIQQDINLSLFKDFQEQGIAFAYPTREIIMRPNGPTKISTEPAVQPPE